MEGKLFKLVNQARTDPSSFCGRLSSISFFNNKILLDLVQYDTELTPENITALKSYLNSQLSPLILSNFTNDPLKISYPINYPPIIIAAHLLLQFHTSLLSPDLKQISIVLEKSSEFLTFSLSFSSETPQISTYLSKSLKSYTEKSRKAAYEIVNSSNLRKKFKKMMLEGNEWISELAKTYGPFTGYELNEFISWFKSFEKEIPKKKNIPKAVDPKPKVLESKIIVNEGGINPEGSVVINKTVKSVNDQSVIEKTTNNFCQKDSEAVKFTFKAKQRYNDLKETLEKLKGNVNEEHVLAMPEKECEEIVKEPPISVPEKYEAFLLEEVLVAPSKTISEVKEKPMFSTNFRLPDNLKIKTETAKELLKYDQNVMNEPYVHKFRDDFDPKSENKPDFVLRLPKPEPEKIEKISEPLEKIKNSLKEEKIKLEIEEKKKRTELYGKKRGEWVNKFKPVSKFYEIGSGEPHKLLPKEEFVETYKLQSRAS